MTLQIGPGAAALVSGAEEAVDCPRTWAYPRDGARSGNGAVGGIVLAASRVSADHVRSHLATGLVGPLQIAVGERGDVYVAQDFAGLLTRIDRRGHQTVLAANPVGEIAGVDVEDGKVFYTSAVGDQTGFTVGRLNKIERDGSSSVVADVLAYERPCSSEVSSPSAFW